jgi:hypothetical protein
MHCSICAELRNEPATRLGVAAGEPELRNAILATTSAYSLIPSVGPLVCGHSLLVPHAHLCSVVADAESSDWEQLTSIMKRLHELTAERDKNEHVILAFEHGAPGQEHHSLCSTVHGHLHLLPMQRFNARKILATLGGCELESFRLSTVHRLADYWDDYLLAFIWHPYEGVRENRIRSAQGMPSQYLRQLSAQQLGVDAWDWKLDPRRKVLWETLSLGFIPNRKIPTCVP